MGAACNLPAVLLFLVSFRFLWHSITQIGLPTESGGLSGKFKSLLLLRPEYWHGGHVQIFDFIMQMARGPDTVLVLDGRVLKIFFRRFGLTCVRVFNTALKVGLMQSLHHPCFLFLFFFFPLARSFHSTCHARLSFTFGLKYSRVTPWLWTDPAKWRGHQEVAAVAGCSVGHDPPLSTNNGELPLRIDQY